jgi:hypothetical protein
MKITRLFFKLNSEGQHYFLDKSYDESITAQENCDNTMKFFSQMIDEGKSIAALAADYNYDDNSVSNPVPVIVNTKIVMVITVTNLAVYETADAKFKQCDCGEGCECGDKS